MNKAKDFLGNEILVDDLVICIHLNYRGFRVAKVVKITAKHLVLDVDIHDRIAHNYKHLFKQDHYQVIKMEDQSYDGYVPF